MKTIKQKRGKEVSPSELVKMFEAAVDANQLHSVKRNLCLALKVSVPLIEYYLVDLKNKRLFEIGDHGQIYHRAFTRINAQKSDFFLWCSWSVFNEMSRWFFTCEKSSISTPWGWALSAAEGAKRIWEFAREADLRVELVNDCDESLFEYNGWPVVASIYHGFKEHIVGVYPDSEPCPT